MNLESAIHPDGWMSDNGLIESFWGYARTRVMRLRGLAKRTFLLHVKEGEFRFNHWGEELYRVILKMF